MTTAFIIVAAIVVIGFLIYTFSDISESSQENEYKRLAEKLKNIWVTILTSKKLTNDEFDSLCSQIKDQIDDTPESYLSNLISDVYSTVLTSIEKDLSKDSALLKTISKLKNQNPDINNLIDFVYEYRLSGDFFPVFLFDIRGIKHRGPEAIEIAKELTQEDRLQLVMEPDNEYDPHAIKVLYNNVHIGYVEKYLSEEITYMLKNHPYECAIDDDLPYHTVMNEDITAIVTFDIKQNISNNNS